MGKVISYIFLGCVVSSYLFSANISYLPDSLSTKVFTAVLGFAFLIFDFINKKSIVISKGFLISNIIAIIFSIICYISTDLNNTIDYSYASYIVSFIIWYFGAYAVCKLLNIIHGEANLRILTYYCAAVCFSQCIIALLIDNIPIVKFVVDMVFYKGNAYYDSIDRLYGIGAALDPAGVRFAITLVLIAAVLSKDAVVRKNKNAIILLLISFFTIVVVGNMISRTTIVGLLGACAYFLLDSGLFNFYLKKDAKKFRIYFSVTLLFAIGISTFLYNTNESFYEQMRFAFEGFFNWVEHGEWRTDSTDKLSNEMWIWPEDQKTWLIGSGLFDNFIYSTDIGYCRFILYCGLIGFSCFAFLFIFNSLLFTQRHPYYWLLFIILLGLTFIIWFKVATDIFFIYALFFCLDSFKGNTQESENSNTHENRILHTRYI
ncbi:hypothetical protein ACFRAE_15530 [Sphingobacterium sp. HJSM2_6]|uniref:hypothetical protein n=1 Tax=Sphingobacterium sp. HJSM2_6 TaxID=3366264 RepID=UPI003BD34BE4